MGKSVMLPLRGPVAFSRGVSSDGPSCVVRLRSRDLTPTSSADFMLVRSEEELGAARASCNGAMIVSDDCLENLGQAAHWTRLIRVPSRFNYFADGDIVGFQPESGKFRTLYRRGSKHNSILVTDRCNHYCLMCSQPPKNIDDRWLLQEIKTALPLVDKDTQFLCFTGGEPLLDWREFIEVLVAAIICRTPRYMSSATDAPSHVTTLLPVGLRSGIPISRWAYRYIRRWITCTTTLSRHAVPLTKPY
jgi:hypothetical protein